MGDGVGVTPETIMTTKAHSVLKIHKRAKIYFHVLTFSF